jgi:hypothetical protein
VHGAIRIAAAAAISFAASAAAPGPVRAPRATGPLLPLTSADQSHSESGCTCTFLVGRGNRSRGLLQLSGHVLLSRTRAGLNICPISEAQFQAIAGPGGSARCAGRRITVRSGATRDLGNDAVAAEATVTVAQGGRTFRLRGTWACAC